MDWFVGALKNNPALALFLALALGYFAGTFRFGRFQLSPMVGVLLAGLVVGQLGISVSGELKTVFFLLYVFALGFKSGPEFFRSLRSNGLRQLALTLLLNFTGFAVAWGIARTMDFDGGTAAGLFAGGMTNSTALGAATTAAQGLQIDADRRASVVKKVATTYALTYLIGVLLVVWFLPTVGPRLMRVNLPEASLDFEKSAEVRPPPAQSPYRQVVVRAYQLPAALDAQTVDHVEHLWPDDQRVVIVRVRRVNAVLDAEPAMRLRAGDVLAVAGRPHTLIADSNPLAVEIDDQDLLAIPTVSGEIVVTNRKFARQNLQSIAQTLGARNIFLTNLKRAGRELPFSPVTVVERGDVLSVSGTRSEIARLAAEIGYAEYPATSTDMSLLAITILLGGLIGLPALTIGSFAFRLTLPVGVLLAGLLLGQLRSINPRFGRIPDVAASLLESLGLASFLALAGLEAGPGITDTVYNSGVPMIGAVAAISLIPHIVTILIGYHIVRLNPAILLGLCAGAGTSAPALAALEKSAGSRVPTLGYGLAYATGNVLTATGATLFIWMT